MVHDQAASGGAEEQDEHAHARADGAGDDDIGQHVEAAQRPADPHPPWQVARDALLLIALRHQADDHQEQRPHDEGEQRGLQRRFDGAAQVAVDRRLRRAEHPREHTRDLPEDEAAGARRAGTVLFRLRQSDDDHARDHQDRPHRAHHREGGLHAAEEAEVVHCQAHQDLPQRRQHHRLHAPDALKEQDVQRQKDHAADAAQPDPPWQTEELRPVQRHPFAHHDEQEHQEHQPRQKRDQRRAVRRARAPAETRVRTRLQRQTAARQDPQEIKHVFFPSFFENDVISTDFYYTKSPRPAQPPSARPDMCDKSKIFRDLSHISVDICDKS